MLDVLLIQSWVIECDVVPIYSSGPCVEVFVG